MASKPTPTPWEAKGDGVFKGRDCFIVCGTDVFSRATNEANAELIAKAVNAYAAQIQAECDCEALKAENARLREALGAARAYAIHEKALQEDTWGIATSNVTGLLAQIDAALGGSDDRS